MGEKLVLVASDDHVDHASGMGKIVEGPCLNAFDILRRDEPGEMHHLQRRRAGLEDDATVRSRDDQRVERPVTHVIAQQRFDQIVQAQPHLPGALGIVGELIPQNPRHLGVVFHELQRHLGVAVVGVGVSLLLRPFHDPGRSDERNELGGFSLDRRERLRAKAHVRQHRLIAANRRFDVLADGCQQAEIAGDEIAGLLRDVEHVIAAKQGGEDAQQHQRQPQRREISRHFQARFR